MATRTSEQHALQRRWTALKGRLAGWSRKNRQKEKELLEDKEKELRRENELRERTEDVLDTASVILASIPVFGPALSEVTGVAGKIIRILGPRPRK
jgi:hypothetical protein